jgi:hypothetical protein
LQKIRRQLPKRFRSEDWDAALNTSRDKNSSISNVFYAGWQLEEAINWGAVQRTESPGTVNPSYKKLRGISKGPVLTHDTEQITTLLATHKKKRHSI